MRLPNPGMLTFGLLPQPAQQRPHVELKRTKPSITSTLQGKGRNRDRENQAESVEEKCETSDDQNGDRKRQRRRLLRGYGEPKETVRFPAQWTRATSS